MCFTIELYLFETLLTCPNVQRVYAKPWTKRILGGLGVRVVLTFCLSLLYRDIVDMCIARTKNGAELVMGGTYCCKRCTNQIYVR